MSAKVVLAFCAAALFVQAISGACLGPAPSVPLVSAPSPCGPALGAPALGAPALSFPALNNIAIPSSGGALLVTSASPFAPSGISVLSENVIEGVVAVDGALPFLSAVALEGQVPSAGSGAVSYSCGNGNVGIVSETLPSASYAAAPLVTAGYGSLGLAPAASYAASPLAAAGYGSLGLASAAAYSSPLQFGGSIAPGYANLADPCGYNVLY